MGNNQSTPASQHAERTVKTNLPKLPMPEPAELDKRFAKVLASMDLPPDKAKLLRSYDDDKKWDLICDQERVSAKEPPESYLVKLKLYLDPSSTSNSKNIRNMLGHKSSTQTLRELEISLRTNHIEWVRQFLGDENNGLDVLVNYLSATQEIMSMQEYNSSNSRESIVNSNKNASRQSVSMDTKGSTLKSATLRHHTPSMRLMHSNSKVNFGDATDDVHVSIMCLRAIMNHQYGFNLVFGHKQAINCIALSLNHKSYRTKALVLELLAAVCLVSGGHEIILAAFDNFKSVCRETHRFELMMRYFKNFEEFHIDFMVACMQFINIVVHSVEDMNFRVHLQHEFSLQGLDDYLEKLRHTESDRLPIQVNAYLDNTIDVQSLLEDADSRTAALEQVALLEDELSHANERVQEIEAAAIAKVVEFHTALSDVIQERDILKELCERYEMEMKRLEDVSANQVFNPQSTDYERMMKHEVEIEAPSVVEIAPLPPPPPPPPTSAPPPPPPPSSNSLTVPPPPPCFGMPGVSVLPKKKKVPTATLR